MESYGEGLHSARTSYAGNNSVAARLKQHALNVQLGEVGSHISAFSPISYRSFDDERPKRKLTEGNKAVVRLIAQYLQGIGLTDTARTLSRESRCIHENAHAARLRESIREGNWDDAVAIVDASYDHLTERVRENARNILLEEKFFKLLVRNKRPLALHMLKVDFDPKNPLRDRLMKLLFQSNEDIKKIYDKNRPINASEYFTNPHWETDRVYARIQKTLPASFMLPENRLQTLLDQALESQASRCETHMYKGARAEAASLLEDHKCPKRDEQYFVETCIRKDHRSPVGKVMFAPCGRYLASASFATEVFFWKVNPATRQLDLVHRTATRANIPGNRDEETAGIAGMSWSCDSQLLAVCGMSDNPFVSLYIYDLYANCLFAHIPHLEQHAFSCIDFTRSTRLGCFTAPAPGGIYHLTVGDMRGGTLQFMEIQQAHARVINIYEGYRIRCVYSCKSGRGAYAADTHNRVRWYRRDRRSDHTVIREENAITSMEMHPSEQLLLLTTRNLGLRMWNVQTRTLIRTFQGYHDGGCVINASFGGINNEYIVAGSFSCDDYDDEGNVVMKDKEEDYSGEETIRIWRLTDEYIVCGIAGHLSTVNCVSWSPGDPFMIASGSDDHSVRLWSCRAEDRGYNDKEVSFATNVPDASNEEEVIDETPLEADDLDDDDEDVDVTGSSSDEEDSDVTTDSSEDDGSDYTSDSSEDEDEAMHQSIRYAETRHPQEVEEEEDGEDGEDEEEGEAYEEEHGEDEEG